MRNVMPESLFHFLRSSAVPNLHLCEPSWGWCPFVGVPTTSDEVETLMTGLIPSSRASFLDFDAVGPQTHSLRVVCGGETKAWRRRSNDAQKVFSTSISERLRFEGQCTNRKLEDEEEYSEFEEVL